MEKENQLIILEKEFDKDTSILSLFLKVDVKALRSTGADGILKKLSAGQLKVLIALMTFVDADGNCFPSLQTLSEVTGMAENTVITAIKGLTDTKVNRQPLLIKEVIGEGKRKKTLYTISIMSTGSKVKTTAATDKGPKYFIDYFFKKYGEEFGGKYKVNGMKDNAVLKTLLTQYSPEELELIIDTVISQYKLRWSSAKFPTPTIGALSWMAMQAMGIIKQSTQINKDRQIEETEEDIEL